MRRVLVPRIIPLCALISVRRSHLAQETKVALAHALENLTLRLVRALAERAAK